MRTISINKILANVFLFFALFPYVSFGLNDMNMQPWHIVFGSISLLFFMSSKVANKTYYLFAFPLLVIVIGILTTETYDFLLFRAIASYFSFFLVLSLFKIYIDRYGMPIKFFVVVNIIYLLSSLVQLNIGFNFLSFLIIPNGFASVTRGVHSLTPEPTYFAIVLFFLNWIYLVSSNYQLPVKIKILFFINIVFVIFIAKSAMVTIFLITAMLVYLFSILKKKNTIYLFFLLMSIFFIMVAIFLNFNPNSRIFNLVSLFQGQQMGVFDSIVTLINLDKSINDRVWNLVFPYYGLFFNYLLPGGFYSFAEISVTLGEYSNGYFWAGFGSNKILSFVGAFIYELGFLGVIFFIVIYTYLRDLHNSKRKFEIILLFIILNSAIPVSFPLVPILIALMLHHKSGHTSNNTHRNSRYRSKP